MSRYYYLNQDVFSFGDEHLLKKGERISMLEEFAGSETALVVDNKGFKFVVYRSFIIPEHTILNQKLIEEFLNE